jgi:hypothetical protein
MELEVTVVPLVRLELPARAVLPMEGVLRRLAVEEQAEVVPPFQPMATA